VNSANAPILTTSRQALGPRGHVKSSKRKPMFSMQSCGADKDLWFTAIKIARFNGD